MRFVEVELPAAVAPRLVIEVESGLRLLLADPLDIGLAAEFIARRCGPPEMKMKRQKSHSRSADIPD